MKVKFRNIKLSAENQKRLVQINSIIAEYQKLNMKLTLRQLYYQLVSRDIIPNKLPEYAKLSNILKEGRMAGIVDWNAIEDRLRKAEKPPSWNTPTEIMDSAIASYEKPRTKGQDNYMEVWVEKDALSGVLSQVTEIYHVPILVNRGYSSASAIYDAYNRFAKALSAGQKVTILYLGDYDPSGVDMIRDVYDRPLEMLLSKALDIVGYLYESDKDFDSLYDNYVYDERTQTIFEEDDEPRFDPYKAMILDRFKVESIALTRPQIDQYNPPPNPAKTTDPRSAQFIREKGSQSWEVDALRPEILNALLTNEIESRLDMKLYHSILDQEQVDIKALETVKKKLPKK